MSRAHFATLLVFAVFAAAAVAAYLFVRPVGWGVAAFLLIGIVGIALSGRVFDRIATRDEKERDLEDRLRNND